MRNFLYSMDNSNMHLPDIHKIQSVYLGKPSIEKTRYNLEIFRIALPLPPSPVFLEKRTLNLSRFA